MHQQLCSGPCFLDGIFRERGGIAAVDLKGYIRKSVTGLEAKLYLRHVQRMGTHSLQSKSSCCATAWRPPKW